MSRFANIWKAVNMAIVGIQLHHHTALGDASRYAANAATAMSAALKRTGSPEDQEILDQLLALSQRISARSREARESFARIRSEQPDVFARARDGSIPWPDETIGTFRARCTCHDRCLHAVGVEPGPNGVCNCEKPPCPAHPQAAA